MVLASYFKFSLFAILNTIKFFTGLNLPFNLTSKIKVCLKLNSELIKFLSFLIFIV